MYMYVICSAMCMTVAGFFFFFFFFYLGLPAGGKGNETAEEYFQRVMDTTSTVILWPSRLKIGAKSKKGIVRLKRSEEERESIYD